LLTISEGNAQFAGWDPPQGAGMRPATAAPRTSGPPARSRFRELDLRADEHDGEGHEQHPADRERRHKPERKGACTPSRIERSSSRWRRAPNTSGPSASAAYPHPSSTYGQGATWSSSGAKRPTARAPAVAAAAESVADVPSRRFVSRRRRYRMPP
jgi:hypothetical protein